MQSDGFRQCFDVIERIPHGAMILENHVAELEVLCSHPAALLPSRDETLWYGSCHSLTCAKSFSWSLILTGKEQVSDDVTKPCSIKE